jgi:hypothetical protein
MIAKQISMRVAKKSNFNELVQYIIHSQNKHERVEHIAVTNCHQDETAMAVKEILAVQQQNTRAGSDKTYHLMISYPEGENPDAAVLEDIEASVCNALGFGEHQRISAVHRDTDHLHVHIAINKIHPRRLTIHNPYCDHKTLGVICDALELKHALIHDNHQPANRGAQSPALSMEHAGGVESLLGWIRRECLTEIRAAGSWQEFHAALQRSGLALTEKGNGLIITDEKGRGVKPSSIARDLSRPQLEKQFGAFVPSRRHLDKPVKAYQPKPMVSRQETAALYADYQLALGRLKVVRTQEITRAREQKNRLTEAAKGEARFKRAAIKRVTDGRLNRKVLYQLASRSLHDKMQSAGLQYRSACKAIRAGSQRPGWLDWLQKRAANGDMGALAALRARKGGHSLGGNAVTGTSNRNAGVVPGMMLDSITKRGTLIYRAGASAVRDDGHYIKVSKVITQKALALSLDLAMHRFGPAIKVEGTAEFKERAVQHAVLARLPLTFDNPELEQQRRALLSGSLTHSQTQEKTHEPDPGGRVASATRSTGRRNAPNQPIQPKHGTSRKPHVARIGTRPPLQAKNRLRDLHELFMAHNAFGSELLLPGHVPGNVEHQQPQAVDSLRRDVPEPGRTIAGSGEEAAKRYIAEREARRAFIKDILPHALCPAGASGRAEFAGWREKDGRPLVLLKAEESAIIVLPVNRETLEQVKQLTIGDAVAFESNGAVQKRGLHL